MKLIYTASQIRDAEKPYIEAPDYDGYLMQRAADAVATEAIDLLDGRQGASVLLLVGPGNNGSDTVYAGARLSSSLAKAVKERACSTLLRLWSM